MYAWIHKKKTLNTAQPPAYLVALVNSIIKYGSIVWNAHLAKPVDTVCQDPEPRSTIKTWDNHSLNEGCVTSMLNKLKL